MLPPDAPAHGEGRVWLRVPASRTKMVTMVSNQVDVSLTLDIGVNGVVQRVTLPPSRVTRVETPIRGGVAPLEIVFRGDRRAVLLETDFH